MKKSFAFLSLCCIIILSACQTPPAPTATQPSTSAAPTTGPAKVPATSTSPAPASPTVAPTDAGPCTDAASFVADVTIPDYSHLDLHETFTKTWRVKNIGTCTWTSDYKAVYVRGDSLGGALSIPLSQTAPGATLDISADMQAPPTDGKFQTFYQLTNASGKAMPVDAGDTLWALITVGKYLVAVPSTPTPGPTASAASSTSGSTGSSSGAGLATVTCSYGTNAAFLAQLVTLINAQRAANSLPALTLNDQLSVAAQNHSEDMACNNFLLHSGWNGSTPASRIAAAGYSASISRENIYAQPPQYGGDPQAAVTWWMGDQTHREAILNAQVTEIGVGYATYVHSDLIGYFTVDFAAP